MQTEDHQKEMAEGQKCHGTTEKLSRPVLRNAGSGAQRSGEGDLCLISTMRTGGYCEQRKQVLINADQAMATVSQSSCLHTILEPCKSLGPFKIERGA